MAEYFFALIPEKKLYGMIRDMKYLILKRYGDQTYLKDFPHLTLYVFSTDKIPKYNRFITKRLKIKIQGWQIFGYDNVTKTSTIGFALKKDKALQEVQINCVKSVKDIVLGVPTRYRDIGFTGIEKENLRRYGFPYVGESWIAHLSLCSMDSRYVEEIRKSISIANIVGEYSLVKLALFKLVNESAVLVWEAKLE